MQPSTKDQNFFKPTFLQQPMSNCYNGYMVNNNNMPSSYIKDFNQVLGGDQLENEEEEEDGENLFGDDMLNDYREMPNLDR